MISILKRLERFLDSEETQMQTDDDPRIQLFIQWYKTYYRGHLSTVPMPQKETQLKYFARNFLKEPLYQLAMTISPTIHAFHNAATQLVRIIAAPMPSKKMNYTRMLRKIQDGTLPEPCTYEGYYECTVQIAGDPYRHWIYFTGDSNQGDKAVLIAAYREREHESTSVFRSIMLTGPTRKIDSQFIRIFSENPGRLNALRLPAICLVFQKVARLFNTSGVTDRQEEEASAYCMHSLDKTTCAYWLGEYCDAKFSIDASEQFCFVAEPTEARAKRILVEIKWNKVIVQQIG